MHETTLSVDYIYGLCYFLPGPASLSVRVLTNELVEVYDWEKLGLNLGIKKYKLREIKKNRSDELSLCKLDLFDLWLRSDITASWQKMIGAVKQLGEYEELVVSLSETYLGIKTSEWWCVCVCVCVCGGGGGMGK